MRLMAWDLETSSLNADYGIILCAGFKLVGEGKPTILSISDYPGYEKNPADDKQLCKDLSERLLESDAWLTWFGTYFDVPFINSRLLYHKLPTLPGNFAHVDGWKTAKNRLKLRNNRLVTVQDFLGLPTEKDAVKGPIWVKAISGNRQALKYVENHCRKDVLVLEEAYNRLRPLIIDHPNSNLVGKDGCCPVCSSPRLQRRGAHIAKTKSFQRFHCQKCGSWSKGRGTLRQAEIKL